MAGGMNLATKYSTKVDERFYRESQAMMALNNDYKFTGDKTVKIYSIPVVPMTNYTRSGTNRYGTPADLTRNLQTMTVSRDRAFTYIIDKGDKIQSEMVSDAGKSLSRQLREVVVPEFDTYVFKSLAAAAQEVGNYASTAVTKDNAYAMFLAGMERMGDNMVPDKGRVAFCTYRFANFLKQDPAFMKYSNLSQEMILKGVIGEVDGCKIVKVPSNRLPAGAAFLITHAVAATAPKQLDEYKIHDNPPGVSGWLVEGRVIYDCFVLNEKANAIYYHGGQGALKALNVITAATSSGKSTVLVNGELEDSTYSYYYKTGTTLTAVAFDNVISTTASGADAGTLYGWTALTNNSEITPTSGDTIVQVVEVLTADMKAKAIGQAVLNIG